MKALIARWRTHPYLKKSLPLIIIVLAILIFLLLMATRPEKVKATAPERLWRIETVAVKLQTLSPTLTLYGKVETPALVKAAAPKKSRVAQVLVKEGEKIKPGQLLVRLDAGDFEPALVQAKAKVKELEALIVSENTQYHADKQALQHEQSVLKLLQAALQRAQRLLKKKLGSKLSLDQAQEALNRQYLTVISRQRAIADHQARLQQLQARLESARAEVRMTELDLQRSRVVSSFAGRVESVEVAVGDPVKDNQILLSYYPLKQLEVRAKIPTPYQAEIQQALNRGEKLKGQAESAVGVFPVQLSRFAGRSDARGIDALFTVLDQNHSLHLGEVVELTLNRPAYNQVTVIPRTALYDNQRVYRLDKATGRMQALTVKKIGNMPQGLLIFSPELQEGDLIITTPLPNAVDGMKVQIATVQKP
jgi:multidrug efflux pump subunit AcrA (membrane-fusion protein)